MTQLRRDTRAASAAHVVRFEPCPKRVRVFLGGVAVADSSRVLTMFETGHPPVYYFPRGDTRWELFTPTSHHTACPYKGTADYATVRAGGREAENAAWFYPDPLPGAPAELAGVVAFYWDRMDAWFEEDEQVYVHPRDPYKRIDVLASSRHVVVRAGGETVAETRRPSLLFETGLPVRYYIPMLDVRQDVLEPSGTTTRCPYKGVASYHSVRTAAGLLPDIAWYYRYPTLECSKIADMICFFNERVDLHVDGELQPAPPAPWS